MSYVGETLSNLLHQTAFFNLSVGNYVMIAVACVFLFLAIKKGFEPLLLVPIAFGMLLVNIYPDIIVSPEHSSNGVGGLLYYFYTLDEWSILPSLIFLGVGAMVRLSQTLSASYSELQHSLVFSELISLQSFSDLMTRQQQPYLSSVELTDLHLFSLPEN